MIRKKLTYFFLALALTLSACSVPAAANSKTPSQVTLRVFAAASLTESFQALGQAFSERNPGISVTYNFAGSQQLANQINQGAPADVFASANQQQMETAFQSGRIAAGDVKEFTSNQLVVVLPKENPGKVNRLQDLANPGLRLILAAKEVPVGQYSLTFLDKASQDPAFSAEYKQRVLKNVVSYEENVKAVLNKVLLGEADAGIVYSSDLSGAARSKARLIDIPAKLNVVAVYPIGVLQDSPHLSAARAFVDFVLSKEGQALLARYGFNPVSK